MPLLLESGKMKGPVKVILEQFLVSPQMTYPITKPTERQHSTYMSVMDPDLFIRLGFTNFSNPWSLKQDTKKTR